MMRKYDLDFSIANLTVRLKPDRELTVTESFRPFLVEGKEEKIPDYTIEFQAVSNLPEFSGEYIYEEGRFSICQLCDGTYIRVFRKEDNQKEFYAVSILEEGNSKVEVRYLEREQKEFCDTQKAFLHIGWEWMLMRQRKMMLHASFVKTPFGGLLFSGPSGIGKSTQADLWCRYGKGKLLNGDKTILEKDANGWIAYGSPYAGSSGCYVNEQCPVRAVFFLRQGAECSLKLLSNAEAFKRLYTGLTVNHWDRFFVDTVSQLAAGMACEVPMYEFISTPDQDAVEYLREMLLKGG